MDGNCKLTTETIKIAPLENLYSIAQFELNSCTPMLVELFEKFHEILVSSTQAMYAHITLCAVQHASNSMMLSSCALPPLNCAHAEYIKHKCPNHSNHWYLIIDTAACIRSQCWCLLLVLSVYIARAQNSFCHFRMVVICATFGLLAVLVFLVSGNMPTAD